MKVWIFLVKQSEIFFSSSKRFISQRIISDVTSCRVTCLIKKLNLWGRYLCHGSTCWSVCDHTKLTLVFRNLLLKSKMFHCFSIVYLGLSVTCCALLCAVVSCDACVPEAA